MAIQTPPIKKPSVKPGEDKMAQAQVIKRPPVVMPAPPKKVIVPARTVLKNSTPKAAPPKAAPPTAAPTRGQDKRFTIPKGAPAINPWNTLIGARGGGGQDPSPPPKRGMGQALSEKFGRLPSNPLEDVSALLNYVASFVEPQSQSVNVNPDQVAASQRGLRQSTTPVTTPNLGYPNGYFNYSPPAGMVVPPSPPAGAVVLPKTPTGAATSNNTGVGGRMF